MNKVISILKNFGWAVVTLLVFIAALAVLVMLGALIALAIPACIVLLIIEAVASFLERVVSIIERKYDEYTKNNSANMCAEESTEDSASNSDAARDTAGTESAGGDDEF